MSILNQENCRISSLDSNIIAQKILYFIEIQTDNEDTEW